MSPSSFSEDADASSSPHFPGPSDKHLYNNAMEPAVAAFQKLNPFVCFAIGPGWRAKVVTNIRKDGAAIDGSDGCMAVQMETRF